VSEASGLSSAVLVRVADFLRDLPPDQLSALARGDLSLAVIGAPAPRRSVVPARSPAPNPVRAIPLPVAAPTVRAALTALTDRASAARYLDDLRLTTTQLRSLARELGLAVSSSAGKSVIRDTIVQWTVGRRVDAAVLSRPRP
jgi:hypothetical protein